jgi:hypothetical protein
VNVFIGCDSRQEVGPSVLAHSIVRRSRKPVSIHFLRLDQLPIKRQGLTQFTFSRYLPPWLMGYRGVSLFLDADMLCLGDISELFELSDSSYDVQVVKNEIRFEWPSLMLFRNEKCRFLTPEYIDAPDSTPQSLEWASRIGDLPAEWNHCVGYDPPKPAKLIHYTQGLPCWLETTGCEYSEEWAAELDSMNSTVSWTELMGRSVHAKPVWERLQKEGKVKFLKEGETV